MPTSRSIVLCGLVTVIAFSKSSMASAKVTWQLRRGCLAFHSHRLLRSDSVKPTSANGPICILCDRKERSRGHIWSKTTYLRVITRIADTAEGSWKTSDPTQIC
ncbi:hypothetical protein V8B97DRAFT_958867 [Scleroderma yunnanense]